MSVRKTLVPGLLLAAAYFVAMLAGRGLDLELEAVALIGVAVGAIVALAPLGSLPARIAGTGAGVLIAGVSTLR